MFTPLGDLKGRNFVDLTLGRISCASDIGGALNSGDTLFTLRHAAAATNALVISLLDIALVFNGTNTPGNCTFSLVRFSAATPTGGTALTPVSVDSARPITFAGDARFNGAALTVAGITFEANAIWSAVLPQTGNGTQRAMPVLETGVIVLRPR